MPGKGLSILLLPALLFSMLTTSAFGDDRTPDTQTKYDMLKARGIFEGSDGGGADLDQSMTRAQFAKILTLVFGLKEATGNSYIDLAGAEWASPYVEAVTKADLMEGESAVRFNPSGDVTLEQMAAVWVRAFQLKPLNDAVPGKVSDWARSYVAAALDAGLIIPDADFTRPALRSELVETVWTVVNRKYGPMVVTATFSAAGVQEIQAAFNKAVDPSKVSFQVTNYGIPVAISQVTWWQDKKTAALVLDKRMNNGDYVITVSGAAAQELTGQVTIEDEKTAKIEIDGDIAPILLNNVNRPIGAKVRYQVLNQYGQPLSKPTSIRWTVSVGSVNDNNLLDGELTISIPANDSLKEGDQFTLSGIEPLSGAATTKVLTAGSRASAASITVQGLYSPSGIKAVDAGNVGSFVILTDVKDQYGYPLKAEDLNGSSENEGMVIVSSSNPSLVKIPSSPFRDNLGPNADQLGVMLEQPETNAYGIGGTAVISFISRYGGTSTTYNLEVK